MFSINRAKSSGDGVATGDTGGDQKIEETGNEKQETSTGDNQPGSASSTAKSKEQRWRRTASADSPYNIIKRIISLLHVFTWTHFGMVDSEIQRNDYI